MTGSVRSIENQTCQGFGITVLDNSSSPETKHAISAYSFAQYISTNPDEPFANIKAAQARMDTPYTILIHDDDLPNIHYVQTLLQVLNTFENISIITSKATNFNQRADVDLLADIFRAIQDDYELVERGNLISVYRHKIRP